MQSGQARIIAIDLRGHGESQSFYWLASVDTYADEGLLTRGQSLEKHFEDCMHALKGSKHVIDVRNCGLMGAVELEPRAGKPGARAYETFPTAFVQNKYSGKLTFNVFQGTSIVGSVFSDSQQLNGALAQVGVISPPAGFSPIWFDRRAQDPWV